MKKLTLLLIVILLIIFGLAVSCVNVITGSGNLETEEFDFSDFNKVEVNSAFEYEIQESNSYSVSVTADDNIIDKVKVSKAGDTLKIGLGTVTGLGHVTLKATITMPQLKALDVSGATRGTVSEFSSMDSLVIAVSGASRITGDIKAGNVEFKIEGASTVQLKGSSNDMVAEVSGASRLNLDDFKVNNADVTLSGASSGTINLSGKLDADLSGASRLSYIGEPTMGIVDISGASTLSKD